MEGENPCAGCEIGLEEPYIICSECVSPEYRLCLHCFAKGWENNFHSNSHDYEIRKADFWLLEPGWTAEEEIRLLEAITDFGPGNWGDISQLLGRESDECEEHYLRCYIEHPHPQLPQLVGQHNPTARKPTPIVFIAGEDPPRPAPGSQLFCDMAGYMAGRGDFIAEYDNYAELDLKDVSFSEEDEEVDTELKLAVLDVYNRRLKERQRRKQIVKRYGLLNMRRTLRCWQDYSRVLPGRLVDKMRQTMRLVPPVKFDIIMEGLCYEGELKQKIHFLQECRESGITHFYATQLYRKLKKRREEQKMERNALNFVLNVLKKDASRGHWKQTPRPQDVTKPPLCRKLSSRLDIANMPGYESLTDKERELCAAVRLVPVAYIDFKNILLNEFRKCGYLKLGQARLLIKIDVNKTRKIYDFLVSEGLVNK
jgi:transcriptional adapter 2-alpha